MKYTVKRIVAILLTLILVLNTAPISVFADNSGDDGKIIDDKVDFENVKISTDKKGANSKGTNQVVTISLVLSGIDKLNPFRGYDYYLVFLDNDNDADCIKLQSAGDYSKSIIIDGTLSFNIVRIDSKQPVDGVTSFANLGVDRITSSGGNKGDVTFTWGPEPVDGKYKITATDTYPSVTYYESDEKTPATVNDGFKYYFVGTDGSNKPIWYKSINATGYYYKNFETRPIDDTPEYANVTIIRTASSVTEGALCEAIKADNYNGWYSSSLFERLSTSQNGIMGDYQYTETAPGSRKFTAVKLPSYTYTIDVPDLDAGETGLGEGFYFLAVDPAVNNNQETKNYYKLSDRLNLNSDVEGRIITFSIGNGQPNDHQYTSTDTVTPHLYYSQDGLNVDNNSGTITTEANKYTEITNNSVVNGFVVAITTTNSSVTYTFTKPEPYTYNIKSSYDSVENAAVFDYSGNWYLLSILTKTDGNKYYYVKQIANNSNTIDKLLNQKIDKFYNNGNLSSIQIASPAGNINIYQTGDSVENKLVYTGSSAASSYKDVIENFADTYNNPTHIVYVGGDVVNKYSLSDNTTAGVGNIVFTLLPDFKLKTVFKDADGNNVANGNVPNDYKLLIKMIANGKVYYALQSISAQNLSEASDAIKFYLYTPGQYGQVGTVDMTTPFYYSGEETLTTQVVTGANSIIDAVEKGIPESVVKYNENTVDAENQNSDLTKDLYSTSSSVSKVGNENIMTTTFTQQQNNGVAHEIEVKFYSEKVAYPGDDDKLIKNAGLDTTEGAYYFVVRLYNNGKLVAYRVQPANVGSVNTTGKFTTTIDKDDTFIIVDDKGVDIPNSNKVKYDPDIYTSKVRFYKTKNRPYSYPAALMSLDGITLATVNDYGTDVIPGYDFLYNKDWTSDVNLKTSDKTQTKLGLYQAQLKKYQIKIVVEDGTELAEGDLLKLYAEASHQTTNTDTYEGIIIEKATKTEENGKTIYTIVIEDQQTNPVTRNWTPGDAENRITGNETFNIYLKQGTISLMDSYPVSLTNGKTENGKKVNYKVTYDTNTVDEDGIFLDKNVVTEDGLTTITHYVYISAVKYESAIGPYDVLGEGAEYGVIADTFDRYAHTETNFAVRKYIENTSAGIDLAANNTTDLQGMPFVVGEFNRMHFTSNTTVNPDIYTPSNSSEPYKHTVNDESTDKIHQDSYQYDVTVYPTSQSDVNKYVTRLINKLSNSSAAYSKKSMISPVGGSVDTTVFPDGITIYVDAAGLNWKDVVRITKLENQTIVFNIPGDNINIQGADSNVVTICRKNSDGTVGAIKTIGTNTAGNGGGTNNDDVENYILNHIVYNAYEATRMTFTSGPAGLFLAPNANVEEVNGSGTGWVATGKTYKQTDAEWHFFRTQRHYSRETVEAGFKASKFLKQDNEDGTTSLIVPDAEQEFTFVLEELNWDLNSSNSWVEKKRVKNNDSLVNFGKIEYDLPDEGVHYYRIYELSPEDHQYSGDNKKYYVKVTVELDKIKGERNKGDGITGLTDLSQLNGFEMRDPVYEYFVFDPSKHDANTEEEIITTEGQTIHETAVITFGDTTTLEPYDSPKEVSRKAINVSQLAVATDTLTNESATSDSDSRDVIVFVNAKNGGKAQLTAKKAGNAGLNGKAFTFVLYNDKNEAIETKIVHVGQTATFTERTYTKAGNYTYVIREILPSDAGEGNSYTVKGITYDPRSYQVIVSVGEDGKGGYVSTVTYDGKEEPLVITNTYTAEGSAKLYAEKANSGNLGNRTFTFELIDDTGDVETVTNVKAGGTGTFSTLTYTKDDLGTYICKVYTYTIREVEDNQKGVQYDKHAHTVTILVEDDGEGNLNVTYDGAQTFTTPVFTNTYTATGTAQLYAQKAKSGDLGTRVFSFVLSGNNVNETIGNVGAGGTATFSAIEY